MRPYISFFLFPKHCRDYVFSTTAHDEDLVLCLNLHSILMKTLYFDSRMTLYLFKIVSFNYEIFFWQILSVVIYEPAFHIFMILPPNFLWTIGFRKVNVAVRLCSSAEYIVTKLSSFVSYILSWFLPIGLIEFGLWES